MEKELRKLLNSSGFLFQLRIEGEIRRESRRWRNIAVEHPCKDTESGKEGFIDLLIGGNGYLRGIIECKRAINGQWIFLLPSPEKKRVELFRSLWTNGIFRTGWHNFYAKPTSYEAAFCVVRGTGEGEKPLLERLASNLLLASDSLAEEEVVFDGDYPGPKIYIPIIVTNALLFLCEFSENQVSIKDGRLPENEGAFSPIPFVRFKKSMGVRLPPGAQYSNLQQKHAAKERTVFAVNSEHLIEFLEGFVEVTPALDHFKFRE